MWEVVFTNDDLGVNAEFTRTAEYFDDPAVEMRLRADIATAPRSPRPVEFI